MLLVVASEHNKEVYVLIQNTFKTKKVLVLSKYDLKRLFKKRVMINLFLRGSTLVPIKLE